MATHKGRGGKPRHPQFDPARRRVLTGIASAAGALALPGCGGSEPVARKPLPDPKLSGINNIVVLMMENRSFDHYLGWLPGADGKQAGLRYVDQNGAGFPTYPLAPEFNGCTKADPDHSYVGGFAQLNDGACDGFLKTAPVGDQFPIGYYTQEDLGFHGDAAPKWTVYDRYFTSIMAETYPNRFYQHSAQTPRIRNGPIQNTLANAAGPTTAETIPTIWDGFDANAGGATSGTAKPTGTYYYNDVPFLGLWGSKYLSNGIARSYSTFLSDAAAGTLPNLAFVDPLFNYEDNGTSRDDHPFADIRDGQVFISQVYNAIVNSPQWQSTVLFINYDEWGGFFDHVVPPDSGVIPDADRAACEKEGVAPFSQLGFRVPVLAVSPFARRGHVDHTQYDHTSILKMIQWRWGLQPMTVRDAIANNIADSLDFANPDFAVPPTYNLTNASTSCPNRPAGTAGPDLGAFAFAKPPATSLTAAQRRHIAEWRALRDLATHHGYPPPTRVA